MNYDACQYVAADGVPCPRIAEDGSFCADHTPEARERLRRLLAEQDAKRCTYVDEAGRCGVRAVEHGRCIRHAPETLERRAREDEARSAEAMSARIEALRAQVEELELVKASAEARARELVAQAEEQKAQNRGLERECRDLRAEQRRIKSEVMEIQQKRAALEGNLPSHGDAENDAKAEALVARAIALLSAADVTEQDRLLAEACTNAAHEHRLWRTFRRRGARPSEDD
jgi:chromosome segregation ATPase